MCVIRNISDYQVKLSEKFDEMGGVVKQLASANNNVNQGDLSAVKSSVSNLEKLQNSILRQIESTG